MRPAARIKIEVRGTYKDVIICTEVSPRQINSHYPSLQILLRNTIQKKTVDI